MVSTRRTPKKSRSPSPAPRKSTPCAPLPLLVSRSAALRAVLRAPPSAARRSRASRKKKAATAPGRELIGAAISVHWEAEKCAPQPAHRAHGAGADSGWSSATAARSHSAARRKWYTGTVSKYNTRSGTHTVDYDDVCAPPRLVLLCVAPEPCAVGQGESIVHDLSQTDYKLDDTDESGTVSALLPQVRRARPAPTAGPYSPKPHLLLEQDGDCVAIRWAGAPACLCILRKDKDGDLIPYPVDGSWEDPNLVFDAGKDDWEWPTDAAFQASSVAGAADDSDDAAPPAHDLNTTLKVRGGEPRLGLRLTARKSNLSFRRRWFSWLLRWAWPVSWSMSRSAKSCGNSLVRRGPPR